MELRIPASGSLKAKRTVVKHVVETAKSRYGVAAAEVGYLDQWQRSELGFAAVAGPPVMWRRSSTPSSGSYGPNPSWRCSPTPRTWLETGE